MGYLTTSDLLRTTWGEPLPIDERITATKDIKDFFEQFSGPSDVADDLCLYHADGNRLILPCWDDLYTEVFIHDDFELANRIKTTRLYQDYHHSHSDSSVLYKSRVSPPLLIDLLDKFGEAFWERESGVRLDGTVSLADVTELFNLGLRSSPTKITPFLFSAALTAKRGVIAALDARYEDRPPMTTPKIAHAISRFPLVFSDFRHDPVTRQAYRWASTDDSDDALLWAIAWVRVSGLRREWAEIGDMVAECRSFGVTFDKAISFHEAGVFGAEVISMASDSGVDPQLMMNLTESLT